MDKLVIAVRFNPVFVLDLLPLHSMTAFMSKRAASHAVILGFAFEAGSPKDGSESLEQFAVPRKFARFLLS